VILVDSSAWIEYLRGTGTLVDERLRRALRSEEPLATTGVVLLEVLAGARNEAHARELTRLLGRCRLLAAQEPSDHEVAAALYRACRREGVTVRRPPDLLIAAIAIRADVSLLHCDSDFEAIAAHAPLRLVDASRGMLIAIDGPAGAGKSTVARALAERLRFTYLDSGAMYRCVGLLALRRSNEAPADLARETQIALADGEVLLDGEDVSTAIRTPEVAEAASRVAADPGVREALVAKQRELIASGDWVAEGRDIGTVVAPDAELKVYLTADPSERARRRAAELGADANRVLAEQAERDERDSSRAHSPLRAAPDAVELDTTGLTVEQVVERIAALVPTRRG
jgi:CMP/dCMP kinase